MLFSGESIGVDFFVEPDQSHIRKFQRVGEPFQRGHVDDLRDLIAIYNTPVTSSISPSRSPTGLPACSPNSRCPSCALRRDRLLIAFPAERFDHEFDIYSGQRSGNWPNGSGKIRGLAHVPPDWAPIQTERVFKVKRAGKL